MSRYSLFTNHFLHKHDDLDENEEQQIQQHLIAKGKLCLIIALMEFVLLSLSCPNMPAGTAFQYIFKTIISIDLFDIFTMHMPQIDPEDLPFT